MTLPTGELVLAGGYTGSQYLDSVETYDVDGWYAGFQPIPTTVYQHCMVLIDNEAVLLIGGIQGSEYSAKTHMFYPALNVWVEGPSLNVARSRHSCGVVKRDVDSGDLSVVVTGGYNGEYLSSVEVFILIIYYNS